eukprot:3996723-Amphidinium_carterae.3
MPYIIQYAGKRRSIEDFLQDVKLDMTAIKRVSEITKEMPAMVVGMRSGAMNKSLGLLKQAVTRVWELTESKRADHVLVQACADLLHDATLVFPMEVSFQTNLTACSTMRAEANQQHMCAELASKCSDLLNLAEDVGEEVCDDVLSGLISHLAAFGPGCMDAATAQETQIMQQAIHKVLVVTGRLLPGANLKVLEKAADAGMRLVKLLHTTTFDSSINLVDMSVSLLSATQSLSVAIEKKDLATSYDATCVLQRAVLKLTPSLGKEGVDKHPCYTAVTSQVSTSKAALHDAQKQLLQTKEEHMSQAQAKLHQYAVESKGGKTWADGLASCADFQGLLELAKNSILTLDGNILGSKHEELQKVWMRNLNPPQTHLI